MKTTCPNCGAPIEFRYDDSFVRVCAHCNNAVLRTDRGVDSLGKVADLVPMESPIKLFSEGHFGSASFIVVGMAQIRHQAGGLWQEWYAKFDGGKWGWLAEAQGHFYLTFEEPWIAAPSIATVGAKIAVPHRGRPTEMTVGEMTSATYVGAVGELPFKLVPNGTFRYADMSDGHGTFATLDFDDGSGPPTLYVGVQVPLSDLKLSGGEDPAVSGAARETPIKSQRLACPACNAPVELRAPGESLRAVCSHCNNLLDTTQGGLQVLGVLAQRAAPRIPLGSKGTFLDGEMTLIGYVQRSANIEDAWYAFDEYLLYKPGLGFRWLVESDGHWSYVQPIATGAVETTVKGCRYDGVSFTRFQQSPLRVDQVLGEFYWQVQQGETVEGEDCVAAPAMVSRETTQSEENWSLSTYMTVREVKHAFGNNDLPLGDGIGIAPNQPDGWKIASGIMSIAFLLLIGLGLFFSMLARDDQKFRHDVVVPATTGTTAPTPQPPTGVAFASDVMECREYRVLLDALNACPVQDIKSTLEQIWTSTQSITDRDTLVMTCQAGIDSVRAMQGDACKLPDHAAVLAQLSGGVGSAAGSDAGAGSADASAFFSEPIQLDGGRNIEISFEAPALDNNWLYVTADLVEEASGSVVTLDGEMEHYSGVDDGESWSEGSRKSREVVGPPHEGTYILRVEGQQGGSTPQTVVVTLKQSVFRGKYLAWAMVILGIPLFLIGLVSWSHEKKRWENSNTGKPPITPVSILVLSVVGIFIGIGYLLKAMAESSSDSDD